MRRCSETWFDEECILIAPPVKNTGILIAGILIIGILIAARSYRLQVLLICCFKLI